MNKMIKVLNCILLVDDDEFTNHINVKVIEKAEGRCVDRTGGKPFSAKSGRAEKLMCLAGADRQCPALFRLIGRV
jgi:hypothetical protein